MKKKLLLLIAFAMAAGVGYTASVSAMDDKDLESGGGLCGVVRRALNQEQRSGYPVGKKTRTDNPAVSVPVSGSGSEAESAKFEIFKRLVWTNAFGKVTAVSALSATALGFASLVANRNDKKTLAKQLKNLAIFLGIVSGGSLAWNSGIMLFGGESDVISV
ncbi:hypothetical protein ACFLY6_00660 [Candidatus Dependentiae bacterium]